MAPFLRPHTDKVPKATALPGAGVQVARAGDWETISMIGSWPGHSAAPATQARERLKAGAGTQFDPGTVDALLRALEDDAA